MSLNCTSADVAKKVFGFFTRIEKQSFLIALLIQPDYLSFIQPKITSCTFRCKLSIA